MMIEKAFSQRANQPRFPHLPLCGEFTDYPLGFVVL